MELVDPDGLVAGYEVHIPHLVLPDSDDRHVLAAAICSGAPYIVTYNLSDFPQSALEHHEVKAVHPDIFLSALFDQKPERFLLTIHEHRTALKNPPKSPQDYIDTLTVNSLNDLALRIEAHRDVI
jgi:hypothetical protein